MRMTFRAFAIASVSALLGSISIAVAPANAAKFAANFFVDIVSGDFLVGETFSGQLVYKARLITGVGVEQVDPASGLISLDFTYVGADLATPITYTEADDDVSAGFPLFIFQDGELAGLDYSVPIISDLVFQFREEPLGSGEFGFFTDNFGGFQTNTGIISFAEPTPVPEPALLAGVGAAMGVAALGRRRWGGC